MEEIVLTNAYVVEQADGTFEAYNCRVTQKGNLLIVKAEEELVSNLHVNLKNTYDINFYTNTLRSFTDVSGLRWVGEKPAELREYRTLK